jgi:hypothetical protein
MFWARITVKEQYAKVFCHYGHITVTALITSSLWFLRLKIFSAATVNANRKKITDFWNNFSHTLHVQFSDVNGQNPSYESQHTQKIFIFTFSVKWWRCFCRSRPKMTSIFF